MVPSRIARGGDYDRAGAPGRCAPEHNEVPYTSAMSDFNPIQGMTLP